LHPKFTYTGTRLKTPVVEQAKSVVHANLMITLQIKNPPEKPGGFLPKANLHISY
jgi:hypothetical protein